MAKVINQNWTLVALLALLIVCISTWNLIPKWARSVAHGDEANIKAPVQEEPGTDLMTYSKVQSLRQRLALTNQDLASLGCTQGTAERILAALVVWEAQNRALLEQAALSKLQAERNLGEAHRRINVGPRDAGLLAQLPQLGLALEIATTQEAQLLDLAVSQVAAHLSPDQSTRWSAVRLTSTGGSIGDKHRHAGGLEPSQRTLLESAIRRSHLDTRSNQQATDALSLSEASVLTALQRQAIQTAQHNSRTHMDGVLLAERVVLPAPNNRLFQGDSNIVSDPGQESP